MPNGSFPEGAVSVYDDDMGAVYDGRDDLLVEL